MMKKVVMFLIGMALVVSGTQAKVIDAGTDITAGGYIDSGLYKVHHTFGLDCVDITSSQNRLVVDWDNNKFQLDALKSADCSNPSTYTGSGIGTLNGVPDATITFSFTDNGNNDYGMIDILSADGKMGMGIMGGLTGGNYQWHS